MRRLLLSSIIAVCLIAASKASSSAKALIIASQNEPNVIILADANEPVLKQTAQWCHDFLKKHNYTVNPVITANPNIGKNPLWSLEVQSNCPIAASLGIDTSFLKTAKLDAYILSVLSKNNRVHVCIVGENVQGVRSGVARLVGCMEEKKGNLLAAEGMQNQSPFFEIRRIEIPPTGRIAQSLILKDKFMDNILKDTLWTNWSDQRLKDYAEQLWLCGFNSVETGELRGYRGIFDDNDLKKITPQIRTFMQAIHDNGMQVSQFIWGQSLFKEGTNLCWNAPDERKVMEKEFERLAKTYGDVVDHIVVHVGDPGGCKRNGCDAYKTTQEIATYLYKAYQKYNPNVTASLNAWANKQFWNGYPGVKFLDESFSSKDIGIALHRGYDAEKAKLVRESGRPVDIWGWYISDFELSLDMSLFMRRTANYFSIIPDEASQNIRAISTEICFQGLPQIINAYVSGQKMWNPRRNLDEIESEFCAGTFGQRNAEDIKKVYQACEAYVHPQNYHHFIPKSECLPVVFGTAEYNKQIREAVKAGNKVTFDVDFKPRFTTATSPTVLKDYLMRDLELIQIFSEAAEEITIGKKKGESTAESKEIFKKAVNRAEKYNEDPDYKYLVKDLNKLL